MSENLSVPTNGDTPVPPVNTNGKARNIGLALVPFTPVPFKGTDAIYAWGRLVIYGGASALLYKKNKTIATGLLIAAGTSLLTSLASESWSK